MDQWDEVHDFNSQMYSVLRATTEGIPFDIVENVATGAGLDAWRCLHRRFDPATGSRKRVMLHALTNPERATYDTLQSALERWKALRIRYDKKRDQLGIREPLPESLAMNALEKLVPKELEQHLLMNFARFKNFEEMEREIVTFIEAKAGSKLVVSGNFAKSSSGHSGAIPMDVDSLVRVVQGSISSLARTKGGGKSGSGGKAGSGGSNKISQKFEGNCDLCGKFGHRKRDCWSGKGSGGGQNNNSSSRSASASPKKDGKFAGKCNHCGKPGHKKSDCWALNGKGKGGAKGAQAPPKPKAASSLESHPEPEPASASGLELCSVEMATITVVGEGEEVDRRIPRSPSYSPPGSSRRSRRSRSASPSRSLVERPFNPDASRSRTTSRRPSRASRPRRTLASSRPSRSRSVRIDESGNEYVMVTPDVTEEENVEEPAAHESLSEVSSVAAGEPNWICCNLDTGASVTVFPKKMLRDLQPGTLRLRTASGEVVQDYGKATIRGSDTTGMRRKLNGSVADVHKVLISAGQMHGKGYMTWLGAGGGEIIPTSHPVSKAMNEAYYKAVGRFGKDGIIPVLEEDGIYNSYLKEEVTADGEMSPRSPSEPPRHMVGGTTVTTEVVPIPRRSPSTTRLACAIEEAILDDGEGGEISEGVEARPAKPGWDPLTPSEEERREHEASGHAVFRNWCQECLAATGYSKQHRRVDHSQETYHTVVMDYFYLGEEEGAKPNLVVQDRSTGMMMATALEKKGQGDTTAQKLLTRFLELLGWKEVVLKSDGEHTLVKMKKLAGRDAATVTKVVCEESPSGDSRANGEAEAAVKEIKWRIRAITMMVEKRFGGKVPEGHPLLTWIPRYAAEQANRYRVGADGKTPEERRTGKKWVKALPIFGERIMIKPAGKGRRGDLAKMRSARFIGCHNRFGSVLGMTEDGVVIGSSYHSLAEDEKWGDLETNLKGSPWDVRAYVKKVQAGEEQLALPAPVPVVIAAPVPGQAQQVGQAGEVQQQAEEMVDKSPMVGAPSGSAPGTPSSKKAWPVRREHLAKFGKTTGCPGCASVARGAGFQQIAHSEECRMRIKRNVDDEFQREKAEIKRLREEERQQTEVAEPMADVAFGPTSRGDAAGGEPVPSVEAAGGEPTRLGDSLPSGGQKRKADEPLDVEDLLKESEAESSMKEASIRAMTEVMGSFESAKMIADLAAMDVIEVFSPKRLNQVVERFGLRKGAAIDLEELKPDGSSYWDLDKQEDFEQALELISMEQPWLVTSSPPCTTFSPLRRLSNFKRPADVVEADWER